MALKVCHFSVPWLWSEKETPNADTRTVPQRVKKRCKCDLIAETLDVGLKGKSRFLEIILLLNTNLMEETSLCSMSGNVSLLNANSPNSFALNKTRRGLKDALPEKISIPISICILKCNLLLSSTFCASTTSGNRGCGAVIFAHWWLLWSELALLDLDRHHAEYRQRPRLARGQ